MNQKEKRRHHGVEELLLPHLETDHDQGLPLALWMFLEYKGSPEKREESQSEDHECCLPLDHKKKKMPQRKPGLHLR